MAMTSYTGETEIITNIGTAPDERGLSTDEFKAKFDEGLKAFVAWFNDTHKTEFDAHLAEEATESKLGHTKMLTANITYYVDIARPDNSGDGLTPATAFKNIVYALSMIPKNLNGYAATVNILAGDYSSEGSILVSNYYGGTLTITAHDGVAAVTNNTNTNFKIYAMRITQCYGRFVVRNLYVTRTDGTASDYGIKAEYSSYVEFTYCIDTVANTVRRGFGFTAGCRGSITNCIASNKGYALYILDVAYIYSSDWTAGTGNTIGLRAQGGSEVVKYTTQPQGTTAESAVTGGVIRT